MNFMKLYVKPQNRIVDLYEEGEILQGSQYGEDTYEVRNDYAEDALSKEKEVWGSQGIWK